MAVPRPNFFIVGAAKCGTSAWVEYLSSHPDVTFSKGKEPHFFCTDLPGFRWAKTEEQYLAFFRHCKGHGIIGEASVQYLFSEEAAKNIAAYYPSAKILICLREHSEFLRSYHNQLLSNQDENIKSLAKAWALSGFREGALIPPRCREPKLLDYKKAGQFDQQILRYMNYFPASQIKVLEYENWTVNPRKYYLEVLDFLGVQDDGRTEFLTVHPAMQARSGLLASLTQRPPGWMLLISNMIKKILRVRKLRLARKIRQLNQKPGYGSLDNELDEEISGFYSASRDRLRALLAELNR